MGIAQQVFRQRDFSAGEMDETVLRRDDIDMAKAGLRRARNKRIIASGGLEQRPGRRALFALDARVDEVRMPGGAIFFLCFLHNGTIEVRTESGTVKVANTAPTWTAANVHLANWSMFGNDIYVCFAGMQPMKLHYEPATAVWTASLYTVDTTQGGQKRTPFYRFALPGITMQPSARNGSITVTFSSAVLTAGHIGTRMRWHERQMTITAVTSPTVGTATVNEGLYETQRLTLATSEPGTWYAVGDRVTGTVSFAEGYVARLGSLTSTVTAAAVAAPGTAYVVGEVLNVLPGASGVGTPAKLTVATVGGAGEILTFTVLTPGDYSTPPTNPVGLTYEGAGAGSGATATLTFGVTNNKLEVVLLNGRSFTAGDEDVDGDKLIGPTGEVDVDAVEKDVPPPHSAVWDEELMNGLRGWPASTFVDQNRLGFCDFPAVDRGIAWSAIDAPDDLHPGADPADGMFELAPSPSRVYHVIPGDDEFVITSIGIFYIPISESNPLIPGSIAFRAISRGLPCSSVRPARTPDGVVFIDASLRRVMAVRATGQTAMPYLAVDVAEFHSHLVAEPIALAATAGDEALPERYVYLLNKGGTIAVGRYDVSRQWVGWVPWEAGGAGSFKWVSAAPGAAPLFGALYGTRHMSEVLDTDAWLDGQVPVNAIPPALVGIGTLWMYANQIVFLMDGAKPMGERDVDANGEIVAIEGEDLSMTALIAGFAWSESAFPFVPHMQAGRSTRQTLRRRKLSTIAVAVKHRTGFTCGPRRIPAWRQGDDQSVAPPMREEVHFFKQLGRTVDPEIALTKDIPGAMRLIEVSAEITV